MCGQLQIMVAAAAGSRADICTFLHTMLASGCAAGSRSAASTQNCVDWHHTSAKFEPKGRAVNAASLYNGIRGQRQCLSCGACSLPLHCVLADQSANYRCHGQDPLLEASPLPCRRFGRVRLQQDPASHPPVSKLGFDPLLGMPTLEEFRGLMAKQRRMLKVVIMDQVKCTLRAVPIM